MHQRSEKYSALTYTMPALMLCIGLLGIFQDLALRIFRVNNFHALLLILIALIFIVTVYMEKNSALWWARMTGIFFAWLTVWGFTNEYILFGRIQINAADHLLHLSLAIFFLWYGYWQTSGPAREKDIALDSSH